MSSILVDSYRIGGPYVLFCGSHVAKAEVYGGLEVFINALSCESRPSRIESLIDSLYPCVLEGVSGSSMVELYKLGYGLDHLCIVCLV